MVKGNNVIWHFALKKNVCVCGGVGREDVGRMGRENSGGFVIYCYREVRWAGP